LEKYEEAIPCYDKCLEIDPNHTRAWIGKGNTLFGLGRYEEAITCYDKAIKINPGDSLALNNRDLALTKLAENKNKE
jgi:tetratricopeptide (TPR) repeat protein